MKTFPSPFLSIGVTTYNRKDSLRRLLSILLSQKFQDIEILVGNDYTNENLTAERIKIYDSRVRFINHSKNLGEVGNMNALLEMARGQYFTWQFDDDSVASEFFNEIHRTILLLGPLKCLTTSYTLFYGERDVPFEKSEAKGRNGVIISGKDFLRDYCLGRLKTMGCTAVYDRVFLKSIGGMPRLCSGKTAIYGEYLLLIQIGKLEHVGWIDQPLVYHRVHKGSWTLSLADLDTFREASANLLEEAGKLLVAPEIRENFDVNFRYFCSLAFSGVIGRLFQKYKRLPFAEVLRFNAALKQRITSIEDSVCYKIARKQLRIETFHHLKTGLILLLKRVWEERLNHRE